MLRHRRLTAFVVTVAAAVLVVPAPAGAEGAHNSVMVVNQTGGRTATGARAVLTMDNSPTVDDENIALARASCTDCRTVAVAVQVVTFEGTVSDFEPVNAAVALNEDCTRCQTYAYARQEVIAVDGDFALSDAGRDEVRRLEGQIERMADSYAPFAEIGSDLDVLTVQLRNVVLGEMDRAGRHVNGRWARRNADVRP